MMLRVSRGMRHFSAAAVTGNPLLDAKLLPHFSAIKPEHVQPAIEKLVTDVERDVTALERKLESGVAADWGHVEELEAATDHLGRAWGTVQHLMGVANSPALREAFAAANPTVIQVQNRIAQSKTLYRLLHKKLQTQYSSSGSDASEAKQRAVELAVRRAELAGVGLSAAAAEAYNSASIALADAAQKFDNNTIDSTAAYALTLTQQSEVEGLPAGLREQYAASARAAGHAGATAESGPWRVGLSVDAVRPFLAHASHRGLREQLHRAFVTRASTGEHDNTPLIRRILELRQSQAELLGYPHHAAVSLAAKSAGTPGDVLRMLDRLREKAYPAAQKELAALQAFAEARGHTGPLRQWDIAYWSEASRKALYDVDEEEVRAYFPLETVMSGMFDLLQQLFGVRMQQVPTQAEGPGSVWHPDVKLYEVLRSGSASGSAGGAGASGGERGERVAQFYFDAFARSGTKRGGAWMDICLQRTANPALRGEGEARLPVAYLTCNSTGGAGAGGGADSIPTLRHSEVTTVLHEMGHGLQHMLTRVNEGDVSGLSGVEWDTVELPSQCIEEFSFDPGFLKAASKHVTTGQPLPDALIAKLRASRMHMAAYGMLRQLFLARTDMELHCGGSGSGAAEDPFAVERAVAATHTILPPLPEDRFLCAFNHIFSGGYSAGYFSYKYAEVLSADAFAAFTEAAAEGPARRAAVGQRFADTVLGLGGSVHPAEVFRRFRGRAPDEVHLLRSYGLA